MIGLVFVILILFSVIFFLIWLWFFKENTKSVENFYKLAIKAFESGNYRKAKAFFLQDSKINLNIDAKLKLGISHMKLEEYEDAKACFESVLKKSPKNLDALINLAKVISSEGNYDEAIQLFNKVAEIDLKNSSQNTINICNVYFSKGDYEKALELLNEAKNKNPDDVDIQFNIIKLKSKMCNIENDEECKQILDEYIKLSNSEKLPSDFSIAIAKAYAINGDSQKAFEYCQKAISLNPEDVEAYQLLGLIQLLMQDFDKAKSNLTIALNIQPSNKETHNIFSYLFCKQVDDCPLQECREKYYKLVKKYLK